MGRGDRSARDPLAHFRTGELSPQGSAIAALTGRARRLLEVLDTRPHEGGCVPGSCGCGLARVRSTLAEAARTLEVACDSGGLILVLQDLEGLGRALTEWTCPVRCGHGCACGREALELEALAIGQAAGEMLGRPRRAGMVL